MKYALLFTLSFIFIFSCREDLDFPQASEKLSFSAQEILLDTLFSNSSSQTYTLKVYNNQDENVVISKIALYGGDSSLYRLNIDGRAVHTAFDVPIRAKDSLYIFIEMVNGNIEKDFAYEDKILFSTSSNEQSIKIISFIENAEYFKPPAGQDYYLIKENTTWTNNKSKVIIGNLKVVNGSTLNITPGTKIYFHDNSSILVDKNASITANGSTNSPIIFRGDKRTPAYDSLPGQWTGIVLDSLSKGDFNHVQIKGAKTGLVARDKSIVNLTNTEVVNHESFGLQFFNATVSAGNLVTNHCGNTAVVIQRGGTYSFNQCSIANYSTYGGNSIPMYISNTDSDRRHFPLTACQITNSILYGNAQNAVYFFFDTRTTINYLFEYNLIKNKDKNTFDYSYDPFFSHNLYNQNPMFTNTNAGTNNLKLLDSSPALDLANITYSMLLPTDFYGVSRLVSPDMGAIESH